MSLENNFLTASIAAKYWGCEVAQIIGYHPLIGTMIEVNNVHITVRFDGSNTSSWDIKKCKLIVNHLSKITDEDCLVVSDIMLVPKSYSDTNKIKKVKSYLFDSECFWCDMGDVDGRGTAIKIIDFLRSKCYDMDNLLRHCVVN